MKIGLRLLPVFLVVGFATNAFGQATIVGTAHDFTSEPWNAEGELCRPCHLPHSGDEAASSGLLWNHEAPVDSGWTLYTTLTGKTSDWTAQSKLCLSCHDGVVALDSYGGAAGSTLISGAANLTRDLSDDHPIGIDYDEGLAGLNAIADIDPLKLYGATNTVECGSCHDPHGAGATLTKFLRMDNAGSLLCTECHNK